MSVDTLPEVTIKRTFKAPRAKVFQAWVDPKQMAQWFGPEGFDNPVCELDVRPGGKLKIHMRGPDGVIYPCHGTFHEIVEPERLVFTSQAIDQDGTVLIEALNTITFADVGAKTALTLHARVVKVVGIGAQYVKGMEQGWSQSFDKLQGLLDAVSSHNRHGRACPGHPRLTCSQDVDARHKTGHDVDRVTSPARPASPATERWPRAQPWSSGCASAPRRRSRRRFPAPAPGRRG
jgi:uncharacterized protein YndB with AHSA1/START domain